MFPCILINWCHQIGYQFQLHQSDWLEHEASACYQLGNWLRCRLRWPLDGNKDMPFSLIHSGSSQIVAIGTIWFWYIVRLLVNLNGSIAKWVIQYESYLHSQQVIRVFCSILVPEYHPAVLIGDESFVELLPTAYFLCKTETKNEFFRRPSIFPWDGNVLLTSS